MFEQEHASLSQLEAPKEFPRASAELKHLSSVSIEQDEERLHKILKGKAREELKQYISQGEILSKRADGIVSVPIHQIDIPHFEFGNNEGGDGEGNGEGQGKKGKNGKNGKGNGAGAGEDAAEHALEVEVTIEELAEILGDELELPRIEPKGKAEIMSDDVAYTTISRQGPRSLAHFRRTFRESLKREIAAGTYNEEDPEIIPRAEDFRFRAAKSSPDFESNAVIFHVMDVSGSMGKAQKEMARAVSFWTDIWIEKHYDHSTHVFISHDAEAKEVDRETFYKQRESGGTKISSAYNLVANLIEGKFPSDQFNIYLFQYSDGDNWSGADNEMCFKLLKERILPHVNLMAYGQVKSESGSGQYIRELMLKFHDDEKVVFTEINHKSDAAKAIKEFLSSGK